MVRSHATCSANVAGKSEGRRRCSSKSLLDRANAGNRGEPAAVGPVVTAQVLLAWSHPGRVRNDAAFAALTGTCPLPASSGQKTRYRLNRGGFRTLNSAIHTIAITGWRCCPKTHDYIVKRRADGKTDREIRRCLKGYITRELHKALANA
ncbi:MAG: IS110 family transposase [Actinomycetota bacterium]|nr:IS110 family transposase [Actinomycetota bacterium]